MARSLQNALETQKKQTEQAKQRISGLLGVPLGGQRRIEVSGRNGYVYVRLRSNQSEIIQAYNNKVATSYGLPVWVVRKGNKYIVEGFDDARYENNLTSQAPFLPRHGNTHSFDPETGGGGDVAWIYQRQITPVLVMPSGSAGADGVIVNPYILKNDNGTWKYVGNTGTASFSPYLPTSPTGAIMGLVCLEVSSGNPMLLINSGTVFSNSITGSSEVVLYIPQLTDPVGNIPLAAVRLITGTNQISWDNIYDVRQLYHTMSTGSGGGSSPIDTGTLNNLYLRLDTSNDPLTGQLLISGTIRNVFDTFVTEAIITIPSGTSSPHNMHQVTRFASGLPPAGGASFRGYGYSLYDSHPFVDYVGGVLFHSTKSGKENFINPYAPSGTVIDFGSETDIGVSGSLIKLRNSGTEKFRVDGEGNIYVNGVAFGGGGDKYPMEARLTLETGVPLSITDQLAKTMLYLTKCNGDQIAVFAAGGTPSNLTLGADISASLAGLGRSQAYTNDPAAGSNIVLNMANTTGFLVGDRVKVSSSAGAENANITAVVANTSITVDVLALNHTTTNPLVIGRLPYDVYVYDSGDGVTAALELVAWTNNTTRATALTAQAGVLVKSGDITRRYIGTIRTTLAIGEAEFSTKEKSVWNQYNRNKLFLTCSDTTNSWTYTTATFRAANGNTADGVGRVSCVIGNADVKFRVDNVNISQNTSANIVCCGGVGIDSKTVSSALIFGIVMGTANAYVAHTAYYEGYPAVGGHWVQRLELSEAAGTTKWGGDVNSPGQILIGMIVEYEG